MTSRLVALAHFSMSDQFQQGRPLTTQRGSGSTLRYAHMAVTIVVEIEDDTDPQEAADEAFKIIGNEPLEKIYSTIRVEWSPSR